MFASTKMKTKNYQNLAIVPKTHFVVQGRFATLITIKRFANEKGCKNNRKTGE